MPLIIGDQFGKYLERKWPDRSLFHGSSCDTIPTINKKNMLESQGPFVMKSTERF